MHISHVLPLHLPCHSLIMYKLAVVLAFMSSIAVDKESQYWS